MMLSTATSRLACPRPSALAARTFSSAIPALAAAPAALSTPQLGIFRLPDIKNEPMLDYAPGSSERAKLQAALGRMRADLVKGPFQVPCYVAGQAVSFGPTSVQPLPFEHATPLASFHSCSPASLNDVVAAALAAKPAWEATPFSDRAAIFLKAADLLSTKYRYDVLAATMLGQGKTVWQAEIDAAAELADFWRFNTKYAAELYAEQPTENAPRQWNRLEYRALEGFVVAYSPFNFTAIGGNLVGAPALMGNVVIWKPSPTAIYSNWLVYKILLEAGLPPNVIQFVPGDAEMVTESLFSHEDFAGLHFTGSTHVFKSLWKKIASNIDIYRSYPRVVGETGGKNMHFLHSTADAGNAARQTVRSAFEYSGQKCSACSRAYVPDNLWPEFKEVLGKELAKIKIGPVDDFTNFASAVINKPSFDKITSYINKIKAGEDKSAKILFGGTYSDTKGYYIDPTVILTTDPKSATMTTELFGPVLTVYVYPSAKYSETLDLADQTGAFALTAALFAQDRAAVVEGSNRLRNAAGNFYINDKCTGAVVGQQPFGGARGSGTNDKAGAKLNLYRWVSARTIKESFTAIPSVEYPSMGSGTN